MLTTGLLRASRFQGALIVFLLSRSLFRGAMIRMCGCFLVRALLPFLS